MSRKPVLEEVNDDDIDNMDLDIAEFDPSLRTPIAPLRPQPEVVRSQDAEPPLFPNIPLQTEEDEDILDRNNFTESEREHIRKYQVVYPCYFDKNRSHKQGRRVSTENAVANPLVYGISDACRFLGIPVILELDKTHPQDFGNPGRVRVLLKENGKASDSRFTTKQSLLNLIARFLKLHPTTLSSIGPSSGVPYPAEYKTGFTPEELPRVKGFKMNTIVPVHSQLTLKHPMTKAIYDQKAPEQVEAPKPVKQQKKKVMRVRG